jgi:hypothetical protein
VSARPWTGAPEPATPRHLAGAGEEGIRPAPRASPLAHSLTLPRSPPPPPLSSTGAERRHGRAAIAAAASDPLEPASCAWRAPRRRLPRPEPLTGAEDHRRLQIEPPPFGSDADVLPRLRPTPSLPRAHLNGYVIPMSIRITPASSSPSPRLVAVAPLLPEFAAAQT